MMPKPEVTIVLELLNRLQHARVKSTATGIFKISHKLMIGTGSRVDSDKREVLRALASQFPRVVLTLDPMDDDIEAEIRESEGIHSASHSLSLSNEGLLKYYPRLYRGNWVALLFTSDHPNVEALPESFPSDPRALQQLVEQVAASAAIVSEPDDTAWTLILSQQ